MRKPKATLYILGLIVVLGLTTVIGCSKSTEQVSPVDSYPSKSIELVVPYAAGGQNDLLARAIATVAPDYLNGQSITVLNKTGGGGTIGISEVFDAKPDGYTIVMATTGPMVIRTHGKTTYRHNDFKPIIQVADTPIGLAVPADAPYNTFEEWLSWVKDTPGKFQYGSPGAGLIQHITMERIVMELGNVSTTHVPFEGGAPAIVSVLGGHTDGVFTLIPELLPYYQEGKLKILFITTENRNSNLPDVPTLSELEIDIKTGSWSGILAPKDNSDEIVANCMMLLN